MRTVTLVCAMSLVPSLGGAQVKLEISPHFSSYYATAYTRRPTADSTERQEAGPGVGLHVTYRFNNIVGVQGALSYIRSGIIPRYPATATGTINPLQPLPGALIFTSLRMTVQPRRSNYYLAGGMGTVTRSGTAWDVPGMDALTNVAVSLGYGIRARVTPEFAFNIGVDAHLYFSNPDRDLEYYSRRLQRDLFVTIGVPFAVIER